MYNILLMRSCLARFLFLASVLAVSLHAQPNLAERGREVFRACGGCHNHLTDARKAAPSLRTLFGKVRLINGKRTTEQSVMELVTEGYNRMPSYKYMLRPQDWEELMAFLKTLKGRPEIVPVLQPIRGTDEEVLKAGKTHYAEHCAGCHEQADGKIPNLLGLYRRETLADGSRIEEAAIVKRAREGHGEMPPKADVFDNSAMFSLVAYLKAQL
jgi:mono/diheme cytochrome c family protein